MKKLPEIVQLVICLLALPFLILWWLFRTSTGDENL